MKTEFLNKAKANLKKVLKITSFKKKNKFDIFFGVIKLDNIDDEIRNLRDDWKQVMKLTKKI